MSDTDLRLEMRELRQRLDDVDLMPISTYGPFPRVRIDKDPPKSNYKLKPGKFPTYNGNKITYAAWRMAMLSTLKRDWNTFGYDNSYVFLSIYNSLEGQAKIEASAYFESGGRDGSQDPEDFIAFLDRCNWDPNKVNRARGELNDMRMGNKQTWNSFFSQWANKLTEANGDKWPDDVKISQLKGKLNLSLRKALANNHLLPSDNYYEWLRIVGQIALQHEELEKDLNGLGYLGSRNNNFHQKSAIQADNDKGAGNGSKELSVSGRERGRVGDVDSNGDTFMGGVNSANVLRGPSGKPLRSKWKSPDQIKRLKEEGRCFRCERKGCSTRVCNVLPAVNPKVRKNNNNSINVANLEPLNLELLEEVGDDKDSCEKGTFSEN